MNANSIKNSQLQDQDRNIPGKTPANPSAFSISSSMGKADMDSSLSCPSNADEGYILVPIPKRRPVSFPIAS